METMQKVEAMLLEVMPAGSAFLLLVAKDADGGVVGNVPREKARRFCELLLEAQSYEADA
jgi:hypothetical protein